MSRSWGTGSVAPHRGAWRVRLPGRYGRRTLAIVETEEEGHRLLAAALEQLAAAPLDAPTLAAWGATWLESRDVRASVLERDRARWRAYVEGSELARAPLVEVDAAAVAAWLRDLRGVRRGRLAAQTRDNALCLVRGALDAATRPGGPLAGRPNPAAGVRLGRRERATSREGWAWLRQGEIDRVLAAPISEARRAWLAVAIYAGLRAGELCGLRWCDVDEERGVLAVRYSREDPPKGGRTREVPLLAPARVALERWHERYETEGVRSPRGLVWPAPDGGCHAAGYDADWPELRAELGVRPSRLHDLRHTCASHLVQGTWAPRLIARALRLEEVAAWLGHASQTTTERYAHLCPEAIGGLVVRGTQIGTQRAATSGNRTPDLRFTKPEPATYSPEEIEAIGAAVPRSVSRLRDAARRCAEAIASGDPHRDHRALDLVDAVAALLDAAEARHGRARSGR